MLQLVRKSDIQPPKYSNPDGMDYCLECWKSWMMGDSDRDLGVKTMAGLVGDGDGRGRDSSEAQQSADNRVGAATDAMIDGLKQIHVWAIYKSCSMATSWRFPNADFVIIAEQARIELEIKLRKNICTAVFF